MKVNFIFMFFWSMSLMFCTSQEDDRWDPVYSNYDPEVMSRESFENSIEILPSTFMKNAGKIYLKDNFMFLGDKHLGFHVYDNSNPENPVPLAFLKIPGATDLAVRDNVIYVNQAIDLVAFSYNPENGSITVHKRIRNTFPQITSPDGFYHDTTENEVVVNWNPKS